MPVELTKVPLVEHHIWMDLDRVIAIEPRDGDRCMVWFEHFPNPFNVMISAEHLKLAAEAATKAKIKAMTPLPAVGR